MLLLKASALLSPREADRLQKVIRETTVIFDPFLAKGLAKDRLHSQEKQPRNIQFGMPGIQLSNVSGSSPTLEGENLIFFLHLIVAGYTKYLVCFKAFKPYYTTQLKMYAILFEGIFRQHWYCFIVPRPRCVLYTDTVNVCLDIATLSPLCSAYDSAHCYIATIAWQS